MPVYEFECEECGGPLRGADRERDAQPALSRVRVGADAPPALAVSPAGRQPRGAAVRSDESRRGEREAARGERLAETKRKRAAGEPPRRAVGGSALSATAEERREQLVALFNEVKGCERCPLHETRTKAVFGAGDADADLMFVGEAPGAEEDRQGLPFVGRAGQLLNQMLEEIGLSREEVFIANVLKSRPPGNRDPQPLEIEACRPYLFEQVRLIEPTVICTLGNFATKLLSGNPAGITKVRGTPQVHELGGRTVFLLPLFHPAAALRTPAVKETLREDFATLPDLLAMGPPVAAKSRRRSPRGGGPSRPPEPPADQLDFFG